MIAAHRNDVRGRWRRALTDAPRPAWIYARSLWPSRATMAILDYARSGAVVL